MFKIDIMEVIRRARKQHKCDYCSGIIYPKNKYSEHKGVSPRIDDEGCQIGIEYYLFRSHLGNSCVGRLVGLTIEEAKNVMHNCNNGSHEYVEDYEFDHYSGHHKVGAPTGIFFCKNCAKKKP